MDSLYVLITPARNEEAHIEKTIQSVISQTFLPKKWVIVSDGSTDRTEEIVESHVKRYPFIQLICRQGDSFRNFGSKASAFNAGYKKMENIQYGFIGNLDADVSFESDYYQRVIEKFKKDEKLGISGGIIFDRYKNGFRRQLAALGSVGGPIQMFRRECFEEIGGFIPLEHGLIDARAEITARMNGWKTQSFPELRILHHRMVGTEGRSLWATRFNQGKSEYLLGYHPFFHIARGNQRLFEVPYIIGSIVRTTGFIWAYLSRPNNRMSGDLLKFVRREEKQKLISIFKFQGLTNR